MEEHRFNVNVMAWQMLTEFSLYTRIVANSNNKQQQNIQRPLVPFSVWSVCACLLGEILFTTNNVKKMREITKYTFIGSQISLKLQYVVQSIN